DAAVGAELAERLRAESGVLSVESIALTGSVLVEYEPHQVQLPWLIQLIVRLGELEGVAVDRLKLPGPQGLAVRDAVERWNNSLIGASRNRVDARTAIPAALFGLGALRFFIGPR